MELAFILSLLFVQLSAIIDGTLINAQNYIKDHKPRWIFRVTIFALIGVGLENAFYSVAAALLFTALFDQCLNYITRKSLWYLGTEASWDVFWRMYKPAYVVMKVLTLISSLILFYYAETLQFNYL